MIKGIGLDLVEMSRIQNIIERQPKFVERVLTSKERERYSQLSAHRKIEYLSGRFAAKEAYAKAVGTGIGSNLSFQDIEIANDSLGKPIVAKPSHSGESVHLTITHTKHTAAAQVIIEENRVHD